MINPQRKPEKGQKNERIQCEDCGLDFNNPAELTRHRDANHSQVNNEDSRNRENVPVE